VLRKTEKFATDGQYKKVEDFIYYRNFAAAFRVDFLDYIVKIIKPVDEVLTKMLNIHAHIWERKTIKDKKSPDYGKTIYVEKDKVHGYVQNIVHWMICKDNLLVDLKRLFSPEIILQE